jgi:hypothetical protein
MDKTYLIYILGIVIFGQVCGYFLKSFFPKYFEEKGRNLATKEDIEEITAKIETVKAEINQSQTRFDTKYKLKYEACLEALQIVDAQLSHLDWTVPNERGIKANTEVKKQFLPTEKVRECQNKLILSCENTDTLNKFIEIMFPKPEKHVLKSLDEFRNLIRQELGFGKKLNLSEDKSWVAKVVFDNDNLKEN